MPTPHPIKNLKNTYVHARELNFVYYFGILPPSYEKLKTLNFAEYFIKHLINKGFLANTTNHQIL